MITEGFKGKTILSNQLLKGLQRFLISLNGSEELVNR